MDRFGMHRSLEPPGALPQQARVLDATSPLRADEIAVSVESLNIDSASWVQLVEECNSDGVAMADRILEIVKAAGKMHNPVTGSGGMLIGTVTELGSHRSEPTVGTRIATLVSLTATPLVLDEIVELDPSSPQIRVRGRAILFGSSIYTEVPTDLDERTVLATLDVCGAPAWVARLVRPGMRVVVMGGGGKSGMLAAAQAARMLGDGGRVLALCWPEATVDSARTVGADAVAVDCTDASAVLESVTTAFDGDSADLVFVCTNVGGCEGPAVLACADEGRVVFFSMATSFSAAALTAEALGKSCELTIGNGFVPGHARLALDLVRSHPELRQKMSE
ncbi:MAG TPA: L-erythro-3,5-diaminohexanoate dehydrogenase [Actinomycetota bacterium]|nr:L-erythro-3,5-diaminohexanoate dehydrogenase [Actinomycetota bacterium]